VPFNIGAPELVIIMVIVLIVFGAGKLPDVMKDLGAGVREFKKAQTEDETPSNVAAGGAERHRV
jgi:sec-independent protein translocase protein TatA